MTDQAHQSQSSPELDLDAVRRLIATVTWYMSPEYEGDFSRSLIVALKAYEKIGVVNSACDALPALQSLLAEVFRLREENTKLRRYTQHTSGCHVSICGNYGCTCGLNTLIGSPDKPLVDRR